MTSTKWEFVGEVGVDSGQLMVTDPCYLVTEWGVKDGPGSYSLDGCWDDSKPGAVAGQLNYNLGHPGAGVVFQSGWGDGVYPVFARRNEHDRVVEVRIVMEEEVPSHD